MIRHLFLFLAFALPLTTHAVRSTPDATSRGAAVEAVARADRLPLQVKSEQHGSRYSGSVSAVLDFPYRQVADALRSGHNWCEIAPLHLNVKACTFEENGARLTFYSGRKHYQPPEKARPFVFRYEVRIDGPDRFEATLVPEAAARKQGSEPIVLHVRPISGNRTSVRALFTHRDTWLTRVAAEGYFATVGQHKKGFTIAGIDAEGQPVYVDGIAGAIERNAARYYFALSAFLATLKSPASERFEQRISRWFDLTNQHRAQLYEMEKDVYLDHKRRERLEQLRLQRQLDLRLTAGQSGQSG